ncbi:hypothetical protein [Streptomyces sp. NPDC127190]|uniref:hypothetical protein n=1 Tax=unclassified Streptomyces TaxID=2593676 RepID=UPI003625CD42
MAEQKSSSVLTAPLRGAASVLRRVPGAGTVSRAAEETLDKVGAVSPRGRRMAVYAGAGLLGAAGVVEWPVALTGAAVAWLTQPRPAHPTEGEAGPGPAPDRAAGTGSGSFGMTAEDPGSASPASPPGRGDSESTSRGDPSMAGGDPAAAEPPGPVAVGDRRVEEGRAEPAGGEAAAEPPHDLGTAALRSGTAEAPPGGGSAPSAGSDRSADEAHPRGVTGPLGPTARPGRTTL